MDTAQVKQLRSLIIQAARAYERARGRRRALLVKLREAEAAVTTARHELNLLVAQTLTEDTRADAALFPPSSPTDHEPGRAPASDPRP